MSLPSGAPEKMEKLGASALMVGKDRVKELLFSYFFQNIPNFIEVLTVDNNDCGIRSMVYPGYLSNSNVGLPSENMKTFKHLWTYLRMCQEKGLCRGYPPILWSSIFSQNTP